MLAVGTGQHKLQLHDNIPDGLQMIGPFLEPLVNAGKNHRLPGAEPLQETMGGRLSVEMFRDIWIKQVPVMGGNAMVVCISIFGLLLVVVD